MSVIHLQGMRINIGARICAERRARNFSQADLERRCGLARCRISWLEHGRAVPTLGTLEKIADALEIPVYRLLQESGEQPQTGLDTDAATMGNRASQRNGTPLHSQMRRHLSRMCEEDKALLVFIAEKMAGRFPRDRALGIKAGSGGRIHK
jgi:transcriptional regulator with XRE-family HTH domain